MVKEHIVYQPASAEHTHFNQSAHIDCRGLSSDSGTGFGILASAARKVEEASYARFRENAARGRIGFACVLAALYGSHTVPKENAYEPRLLH